MKQYCIRTDSTLMECLRVIDGSAAGIALAVDSDFRLIGTVSDGDIRRVLLKGYPLETPVLQFVNKNCFCVLPTVGRTEVLDIMQARRFEQVPIVDEQGKVTGLHLLHDILGNAERPNWGVVMAGGKGLRLRPLTENIPKPMIRVAGRPILERIILHLVSYGIRRIFVSVNHLAHVIEDYFGGGSRYGATIEYLHEDQALGSGGAISLLPELPEQALLVLNGDLIVDTNFAEMIEFHDQNDFYGTIGVYSYFHEVPYGCVEIQNSRLTSLEEKPVLEKKVNAGIYVLSPQAVSAIPKNTLFPMTMLFEEALKKNLVCGTFSIEKEWLDIGSRRQLLQAQGEL